MSNDTTKKENDFTVFDSGAKRSERAPFYAAIPPDSLRRVALRATGAPRGEKLEHNGREYEGGSRKYGYGNWMQGLPLEDTVNHLQEHLGKWLEDIRRGIVPKEDHLSAIAWGVLMPLMTFEREYANQMRHRGLIMAEASQDPVTIDKQMEVNFPYGYLLQPLAPEK